MTEKQYLNKIMKKIKCSENQKIEIKKQLQAEMECHLRNGKSLESTLQQMGTIEEIAESYNENISEKEKKVYTRNKILKIIAPIGVVLIIVMIALNLMLPKTLDIEKSVYFEKSKIEESAKTCIELLNQEEYTKLQEGAIDTLKPTLTKEVMDQAKSQIQDDWGKQVSYGTIYMAEIKQLNMHYAVCEITVVYENVSVTYRLTFNDTMQLAGLYVR